MSDLSLLPWQLLLPGNPEAPILWLGGDDALLQEIAAHRRIETSDAAGPFAAVVRGRGGPESLPVARQDLPRVFLPDGYLLWISDRPNTQIALNACNGPGFDEMKIYSFRADGRSLWSEDALWAEPLRGAGKRELVMRLLVRFSPRWFSAIRTRRICSVMIARNIDALSGPWIFELLADLGRRGVAEFPDRSLGRLDTTANGAAIGQMVTTSGTRLAVKIALNDQVASEMVREQSNLERLRQRIESCPQLSGTLPSGLASDYLHGRYYRVDEWMPGRSAVELMYHRTKRERVVVAAIHWVTALHERTLGEPLDSAAIADWARSALKHIAAKDRQEDGKFAEQIADYLHTRLEGHTTPTVFGHGDFWLGNVLHEPESCAVTGVIDWNYADDKAPPLEDLLHLLCHRKWLFSVYDPGLHLTALFRAKYDGRDQQRIAEYMRALNLAPELAACLIILYWIRYLATRAPTLSSRPGWYARSYRRVKHALVARLGPELDTLGDRLATGGV